VVVRASIPPRPQALDSNPVRRASTHGSTSISYISCRGSYRKVRRGRRDSARVARPSSVSNVSQPRRSGGRGAVSSCLSGCPHSFVEAPQRAGLSTKQHKVRDENSSCVSRVVRARSLQGLSKALARPSGVQRAIRGVSGSAAALNGIFSRSQKWLSLLCPSCTSVPAPHRASVHGSPAAGAGWAPPQAFVTSTSARTPPLRMGQLYSRSTNFARSCGFSVLSTTPNSCVTMISSSLSLIS